MNTSETVYDYVIAIDSTIDNDSDYIGYSTLASAKRAIAFYVATWYIDDDQTKDFLQELVNVPDNMSSWSRSLSGLVFQIVRQAVG